MKVNSKVVSRFVKLRVGEERDDFVVVNVEHIVSVSPLFDNPDKYAVSFLNKEEWYVLAEDVEKLLLPLLGVDISGTP